jgi:hypothetical protein
MWDKHREWRTFYCHVDRLEEKLNEIHKMQLIIFSVLHTASGQHARIIAHTR